MLLRLLERTGSSFIVCTVNALPPVAVAINVVVKSASEVVAKVDCCKPCGGKDFIPAEGLLDGEFNKKEGFEGDDGTESVSRDDEVRPLESRPEIVKLLPTLPVALAITPPCEYPSLAFARM